MDEISTQIPNPCHIRGRKKHYFNLTTLPWQMKNENHVGVSFKGQVGQYVQCLLLIGGNYKDYEK